MPYVRVGDADNHIHVSGTAARLLLLLQQYRNGLTRMDLHHLGHPGLVVSTPQNVARLRAAGVPIETITERAANRDGRTVTFARWRLVGDVEWVEAPRPSPNRDVPRARRNSSQA